MDSLLAFILTYRSALGAVLLLLLTTVVIWKWWESVSFWWLRVWCSIPVFGTISLLASRKGLQKPDSWLKPEKDLCGSFYRYYDNNDVDAEYFVKCKNYLVKAQESNRNELAFWGWLGIAVMVFLEAMGFAYVLAGYTIPGASEALQQKGAVGIALLISGILVILTHFTGHELHLNSLINKINKWKSVGVIKPQNLVEGQQGYLIDGQIDDQEDQAQQLCNRLRHANADVDPTYKITSATIIVIVLVAIGATYVRGQVLEKQLAAQHLYENSSNIYGTPPSYGATDPYSTTASNNANVPQELLTAQQKTDRKVEGEVIAAERKGGWATFIVLAIIFIFLQIIGILIGYRTGFACDESSAARRAVGNFKDKNDFAEFHERKRENVATIAQNKLDKLQSKLIKIRNRGDERAQGLLERCEERTFVVFCNERRLAKSKNSYAGANRRPREVSITREMKQIDNIDAHSIPEETIQGWMDKLHWPREKTVEFLLRKGMGQPKEHPKSEADADSMFEQEAKENAPLSDDEANRLWGSTTGGEPA